jgi:hypothetical protein
MVLVVVSWQKESVYASIKALITRTGNCRTVSALKSTPKASSTVGNAQKIVQTCGGVLC